MLCERALRQQTRVAVILRAGGGVQEHVERRINCRAGRCVRGCPDAFAKIYSLSGTESGGMRTLGGCGGGREQARDGGEAVVMV